MSAESPSSTMDRLAGSLATFAGGGTLSRADCVFVTIAKLVNVRDGELDRRVSVMRPPPGSAGVPTRHITTMFEDLRCAFVKGMFVGDIEAFAQSFAESMRTKKVGVCYLRPNGGGHCVVYQFVQNSTSRISSTGRWRFVDYQVALRESISGEMSRPGCASWSSHSNQRTTIDLH